MKKIILNATVSMFSLLVVGCSTISGSGTSQPISVQTFTSNGADIDGAKCDMTNDEGTWFVTTPGSTTVHRSNKDLQVICRKPGTELGNATVVSRTKANMWGNVIFGGGVGAIIDHNNGSAYEYPGLIKIFMGRSNQRIEEGSAQATQVIKTPNEQLAGNETNVIPSSNSLFQDAKIKCTEIGLTQGSEQFANCVMKLSK